MPEKNTIERARKDAREGKAPSTQAGEFVHEEIKHIREGKHGARSTKHCNWTVEGKKGGCRVAAARERKGLGGNPKAGSACFG